MRNYVKRLTACLLAVLMILTCTYTNVSAATMEKVYVKGTFMQTESRNMLNKINKFRQNSKQAWAWNESNSKKVYYSNLKALKYDYTLEKMAMQRAAELAIVFDHVRPNGDICFSAFDEYSYYYMAAGENIAAGYGSASDVFEGWKEENEPYEYQGHRRNMLSSDFTHIGIAGVKVGGTKYWVQVLAQPNGTANETKTSACDTSKKVKVEVDSSEVTAKITKKPESLTVIIGESVKLPTVTLKLNSPYSLSSVLTVTAECNWSYSGSGASISGNKILGNAKGEGTLKATIFGKKVSIPVTVKKPDNKITASNQTEVYSTSKRTLELNAQCQEDAALTYKSNNKKITVSSTGTVTVPAKFIGKATITITAAETGTYAKTQKKITVTVKPTKTTLKSVSNPSKKKMKITWKKNSVGTGYQIMYATNADFTKNKTTKLIKKNGTLSATYNVTKGKTYYVKIRTYKTVGDVKYYSDWSVAKKIKIKK